VLKVPRIQSDVPLQPFALLAVLSLALLLLAP
jgi:hypothetical protein